jgi:Tfp pilus assembly protein PilF
VTSLTYSPVRHHEFLNWDDLTYVEGNDHVKGGLTREGIAWAFTSSYSANWHPLTWLSHMVDCQLFGLNAGAHHLVNVAFHVINTLLLFGFLRAATGALWRSSLVAALFALHPLHVESVAWLAERKDMLSTFFFLLTLIAYVRYVKSVESPGSRERPAVSGRRTRLSYCMVLVLFALGLMSKPMLVTLPFVLLLLDYWPLHRFQLATLNSQLATLWPLLREKIPFFALTIASCILTYLAQQKSGAVATFEMVPFGLRIENALVAYVEYLSKFFWPAELSPLYPHPDHSEWWQVAGAFALLAFLTAGVWRERLRFPCALTGWLWFLGTLAPVIGIVQVGSQAFADRYTYIPLIGIMIAVVWSGAYFVVLSPWSVVRSPWFVAVACSVILMALACLTRQQLAFWSTTQTLFRRALALAPNSVQATYGLGTDLVDHGQVEEGKKLLEEAIRLQPASPEALGAMANLLDGQGKYADAIRFYESALKAQPDHAGVLNNLAWLRASCSDPAFRDGVEAVRQATRACELTHYQKPLFIGTLAAAQAEAGDFQSAIATAEQAAALATSLRLEDTAKRNRELIELYRQGKAAHGGAPKPNHEKKEERR